MSIPMFADMVYEVPTLEGVRAELEAITADLDSATTTEAQIEAIRAWIQSRDRRDTWSALVDLHFNQDTEKPECKAARERRDELAPQLQELDVEFKKKLLVHSNRKAIEAHFGTQAFALWDADARSFAPVLQDDLVAESKLEAEYTELLSSARFEFRGESLNLSTITKYLVDANRETREAASRLRWEWFDAKSAELDRIYDELTRLRHGMSQKLGLRDFVELGYLNMQRVDYDRNDVEKLRAQIRDEVVPLCTEIRAKQAESLGLAPGAMRHWDEEVFGLEGNPAPKGGHDWMVERATEMFDEMGHGLGSFFRLMTERDLLDLRSRDRKAPGGFCTSMPVYGVPFVYANFNGTKGDVEVFTHEIGHAFQNYSSRNQIINDYYWPTYEGAEIHSMSLEFLTWPWMEKFFEEDAERFRRIHLTQSLLFLPYGTAVDHFQHLVYENPAASPEDRHRMWQDMERVYLPWRNYGGHPHVTKGGFWQRQSHIYGAPFYYIDYVLAQICALQFWVKADADRASAMQAYAALCERGGEAPFQSLVSGAGLVSPFAAGCLTAAVRKAQDYLA